MIACFRRANISIKMELVTVTAPTTRKVFEPLHQKKTQTICICETKGAGQLCSDCTADLHLCFRSMDSTIPPLSEYEI